MDEQPKAGGLAATKVLIKALIEDHGFVPENVDKQRRRSISNIERDFKAWETYRRCRVIEVDCEAWPVIDAASVERRLLAAPEAETGPAQELVSEKQSQKADR